jgi:hypothetical protein
MARLIAWSSEAIAMRWVRADAAGLLIDDIATAVHDHAISFARN